MSWLDSRCCGCERLHDPGLRTWLEIAEVLLARQSAHPVSCSAALACSRPCLARVSARLLGLTAVRWRPRLLPPLPPDPSADRWRGVLEPLLRESSTVRLAVVRSETSAAGTLLSVAPGPSIFLPPVFWLRPFLDAATGRDPVEVAEVFSVLVSEGLPVLDALEASSRLV